MSAVYQDMIDHSMDPPDIERPGLTGVQGLKYQGKMSAMFYKRGMTL
jgi:hypothetical protein